MKLPGERKESEEGWRSVGWSCAFHMEMFWSEPIGSEISAALLLKREVGEGRADGHISPQATWSIPHVTHSRALERRRRGPREWGWGWEDGLTVNPAQRHLVSYQEAGCELREGRGHECVPRVSWWFMASSRVLSESCSWPRRPTETVSEIKSPWRYVLEIAPSQLECGSEDTIPSLSLIFFQAIWRFYGLKCSLGALDLLQVQKKCLGSSVK